MSCKNVQPIEHDPKVTQYTGTVDKEWLKGQGGVLSEATNIDDTWTLLRMMPASLLKTGIGRRKSNQFRAGVDSTRS